VNSKALLLPSLFFAVAALVTVGCYPNPDDLRGAGDHTGSSGVGGTGVGGRLGIGGRMSGAGGGGGTVGVGGMTGGGSGVGGSTGGGTGGTGGGTISTMEWTIYDECVDGLAIQARFFDIDNDTYWPANASLTYSTTGDLDFVDVVLSCVPGDLVCDGASTVPYDDTVSWGVGLYNTEICDNCCYVCGEDDPTFDVTCD
jgi:hypothetical protein